MSSVDGSAADTRREKKIQRKAYQNQGRPRVNHISSRRGRCGSTVDIRITWKLKMSEANFPSATFDRVNFIVPFAIWR